MNNVNESFDMKSRKYTLFDGTFFQICLFESPVFIVTGYTINTGYYYFVDLHNR